MLVDEMQKKIREGSKIQGEEIPERGEQRFNGTHFLN